VRLRSLHSYAKEPKAHGVGFGDGTPGLAKCNLRIGWNITRPCMAVNEQFARPSLNGVRHIDKPGVR